MCRPSQTPHQSMSSSRVRPRGPLILESSSRQRTRTSHQGVSKAIRKVVVFQDRRSSHLCYTLTITSQRLTRVKLNRVFFPRWLFHARSHGCEEKYFLLSFYSSEHTHRRGMKPTKIIFHRSFRLFRPLFDANCGRFGQNKGLRHCIENLSFQFHPPIFSGECHRRTFSRQQPKKNQKLQGVLT